MYDVYIATAFFKGLKRKLNSAGQHTKFVGILY